MIPVSALDEHLSAKRRRWLVTGCAGFIGSHLLERLLSAGQLVVGLDNFITGHRTNLDDVRRSVGEDAWQRCSFVEGDIRDAATCQSVCIDVDHVLHQAAMGSVPRSIEDPATSHACNVDGFLNVLDAARRAGAKTFVYASSSSVYGDSPVLPKKEDALGAPLSPYAATKRIDELYADVWNRCYGLACVGLRYFNVVGPRQDPQGPYAAVVPRWISALSEGRAGVIYGDGKTSRDFCPIDNVVQVNLLATVNAPLENRVFNVALGGQTTLHDLYEILRAELGELGAPVESAEPEFEPFRAGDIRHSLADVMAARADLGYDPQVDLAQGLRLTCEWFWRTRR